MEYFVSVLLCAAVAGAVEVAMDKSRKPIFQDLPQKNVTAREIIFLWIGGTLFYALTPPHYTALAVLIGFPAGFLIAWWFIPRKVQWK